MPPPPGGAGLNVGAGGATGAVGITGAIGTTSGVSKSAAVLPSKCSVALLPQFGQGLFALPL